MPPWPKGHCCVGARVLRSRGCDDDLALEVHGHVGLPGTVASPTDEARAQAAQAPLVFLLVQAPKTVVILPEVPTGMVVPGDQKIAKELVLAVRAVQLAIAVVAPALDVVLDVDAGVLEPEGQGAHPVWEIARLGGNRTVAAKAAVSGVLEPGGRVLREVSEVPGRPPLANVRLPEAVLPPAGQVARSLVVEPSPTAVRTLEAAPLQVVVVLVDGHAGVATPGRQLRRADNAVRLRGAASPAAPASGRDLVLAEGLEAGGHGHIGGHGSTRPRTPAADIPGHVVPAGVNAIGEDPAGKAEAYGEGLEEPGTRRPGTLPGGDIAPARGLWRMLGLQSTEWWASWAAGVLGRCAHLHPKAIEVHSAAGVVARADVGHPWVGARHDAVTVVADAVRDRGRRLTVVLNRRELQAGQRVEGPVPHGAAV